VESQKKTQPPETKASSRKAGISGPILPGWRRSAHRTSLQLNSLQTGNFTGKITISGLKTTILEQETAAPQGLFGKFPKQTIREKFLLNREFKATNRGFFGESGKRHFSSAWFSPSAEDVEPRWS
jgi:hypothetical protein